MAWQDEVAQKRRDSAQQKTISGMAKSQDIDSVLQQLKELQLTTMLSGSKPSVVLTDQTDLGDKIKELTDQLVTAVKSLDSSETDDKQLTQLSMVQNMLGDLNKSITSGNTNMAKSFGVLVRAIKAVSVSPVVNVPAPKVTVEPSKVDLIPLQTTLERYMAPNTEDSDVELDDFRAQDINDGKDIQYVGFMHPNGNWYIIENNVKNNSLRYVFGNDGYAEAFANAGSYEYSLLNEAIRALST